MSDRAMTMSCLIGLGLLLVSRLWLNAVLPLMDSTEGRYGAIALEMYQSGNWVTPKIWVHGELVPYWGKPPLYFWLTAISYACFGVSEWAARLPSLLASAGTMWLTFRLAMDVLGSRASAWLSVLVLGSSALFFAGSGLVALDSLTAFTVTGIIASFVIAMRADRPGRWGYAFFLFMAIGMLAKGPIALVLGVVPVFAYCLIGQRWSQFQALPWITGSILFLVISAPWYVTAEFRTPGFCEYFFLREHVLRFVSRDFGDLYGKARVSPRGWSFVLLLLGVFPWAFFGSTWLSRTVKWLRARPLRDSIQTDWLGLVIAWALLPAIFFAPARSVLAPYLLPGMGGIAILISIDLNERLRGGTWKAPFVAIPSAMLLALICTIAARGLLEGPTYLFPLVSGSMILAFMVVFTLRARSPAIPVVVGSFSPMILVGALWCGVPRLDADCSTRQLIETACAQSGAEVRLILVGRGEPSMHFYYAGEILRLHSPEDPLLREHLSDNVSDSYLIRSKYLDRLPKEADQLLPVMRRGKFWIFTEKDQAFRPSH